MLSAATKISGHFIIVPSHYPHAFYCQSHVEMTPACGVFSPLAPLASSVKTWIDLFSPLPQTQSHGNHLPPHASPGKHDL